mgnify:CR=1 FL=1
MEFLVRTSDPVFPSKVIAKLTVTPDSDSAGLWWCRCCMLPEGHLIEAMRAKLTARQHINHLTDEEIDSMSRLAGADWNYGGYRSVHEATNAGMVYAMIQAGMLFPVERIST